MFWDRISSVIEYFLRQSIHTPVLVFQIGEGAKLRFAPLGQEAPASVQIASGSKR